MRYTNTSDNRKFGGFCEEKIDSLVRQETCSLSLLLLFPLLHLQTERVFLAGWSGVKWGALTSLGVGRYSGGGLYDSL